MSGLALPGCSNETTTTVPNGSGGSNACVPELPPPESCPPAMAIAEGAFEEVVARCGIDTDDLNISDPDNPTPDNPTLGAEREPLACSSCQCRQAIFNYHSVYRGCDNTELGGDRANASFAASLHALAEACP
ncbi:MAG: hypothetical protein AAGA56_14730 [Myxococcota bacterium]